MFWVVRVDPPHDWESAHRILISIAAFAARFGNQNPVLVSEFLSQTLEQSVLGCRKKGVPNPGSSEFLS